MLNLKKLIESVFLHSRHFSKRIYTMGLLVFSGVVAIAVVMIGVNGFSGKQVVSGQVTYDVEEDEAIVATQETNDVTEEAEEVSQISVEAKALSNLAVLDESPSPQLQQAAIEEKNLRTSGNLEASQAELLNLRDYTALVRIVEAEATGEDLKGKILIANVVMNRARSNRFPDTIYDVVHQKIDGKAQFSPIDDRRYYTVSVTKSSIEAVEMALSGTDYSKGALFFVAKSLASEKASSWFDNHLTQVLQHGVHTFYKY